MLETLESRKEVIDEVLSSPGTRWEDLTQIARNYGGDQNDLDDIVSHAIEKVWKSPSLMKVKENKFKINTYLRSSVRTAVKDYWRKRNRKFQTKIQIQTYADRIDETFHKHCLKFDTWEEQFQKFSGYVRRTTEDPHLIEHLEKLAHGMEFSQGHEKTDFLLDLYRDWWYRSLEPRVRRKLSRPRCLCGKIYRTKLPSGECRRALREFQDGYSGYRISEFGKPVFAPWCNQCCERSIQIDTGENFQPVWELVRGNSPAPRNAQKFLQVKGGLQECFNDGYALLTRQPPI